MATSSEDHATHVSCTIGGSGAVSGGKYRGMAPGVTIVGYGFEQNEEDELVGLYADPGDLEADYNDAINVNGADLANNSIGTNACKRGLPCESEWRLRRNRFGNRRGG